MPTKQSHEEKRTSSLVFYCGVCFSSLLRSSSFLFATSLSTPRGAPGSKPTEGLLVEYEGMNRRLRMYVSVLVEYECVAEYTCTCV